MTHHHHHCCNPGLSCPLLTACVSSRPGEEKRKGPLNRAVAHAKVQRLKKVGLFGKHPGTLKWHMMGLQRKGGRTQQRHREKQRLEMDSCLCS